MEIKKIGKIPDEKDLQEYLEQRVIPVRFCYPEEGGDKWHELRSNDKYKLGKRELTAFNGSLPEIKKIIGDQPINLVHLGPGDGIEIPYLFEIFKPNKGKYVGVDISKQMIKNTFNLNKSYFSNINPLWYLTDIETGGNLELICKDIKNKGADRSLFLLTNQRVLFSNPKTSKNLYHSMQNKDYLFITIEGDDLNKRKEICKTYNLPGVRNLLSVGLRRAGYNPKKGKFKEATFNEEKSQVEVYFKPKNEEEILCLTSYKPRVNEFESRLNKNGFDIKFLKFYEDVHTFAALCKKVGYDDKQGHR